MVVKKKPLNYCRTENESHACNMSVYEKEFWGDCI